MDYDADGYNLDVFLRRSDELRDFLHEVGEQGAERWRARSRIRTGFNASHVESYVDHDETGVLQGNTHATGHYARYREHGTRWNDPENVLQDFKHDIEG